jgi:hypothetical protein
VRGDLSETTHTALLTALADARARGRLVVDGPDGAGKVSFWDGLIIDAHSPAPRARPLERLVTAGRLKEETAAGIRARSNDGRDEAAVLAALRHTEGIETDVLRRLRTEPVLDAVTELLSWRFGRYAFIDAADVDPDPDAPNLAVEAVLAEAGRRRGRLDQHATLLPSLDVVPVPGPGVPDTLDLGVLATALLAAIDGRRSLGMLAEQLGFGGLEIVRVVAGLQALGLVQVATPEDEIGAVWDDVLANDHGPVASMPPDAGNEAETPQPSADGTAAPPGSSVEDAPAPPEPTDPTAGDPEPSEDVTTAASPGRRGGGTDVAEFLRELSSLSLSDDEAGTPNRRRRAPGGDSSGSGNGDDGHGERRKSEPARRRRGLFGRG